MPNLYDAHARHVHLYLLLAEKAGELFVKDLTRSKGVTNFDQNRGQIEAALEWVVGQGETRERDIVLATFINALSALGMVRYSIKDKLIPLLLQRVSAAQRLGLKDMEADAYDDLGIKYAYLGYLRRAIEVFETAHAIASETSDKELVRDIENHLQLARNQLKGHKQQPGKILALLLPLPILQLKRWFAIVSKNPFMEIMVINQIASIYLEWGSLEAATSLFRRAILLSKEHAYRFGELDASMGMLHVEILKGPTMGEEFTSLPLEDNREFEWSNDLLVLETLLDLAPAIQTAETMAQSLQKNNDPRAAKIYKLLDQILAETDNILSGSQQESNNKQETFLSALTIIKDSLTAIMKMYSTWDPR